MENEKHQGGAAVMEAPAPVAEEKKEPQAEASKAEDKPEVKPETAPQPKAEAKIEAVEPAEEAPKKKGRTFLYTFIVLLFWLVAKICFFLRIEGKENVPKDRNVVLMGNHQCILDPVVLALCVMDREIHFMGKKELFESKIGNWVFTKVHGFPVDRGNVDMGAIRTALGILKDGDTLGIFPEGTRSKDGHMLPLLGGASMIALKSGCDVVPVYIDGRYKVFRPMVVRVGKPIEIAEIKKNYKGKAAVDGLTSKMEESFFELSHGKSRAA